MLGVMLVLFGLYAKFVGIKTVYRGRGKTIADGQCVPTTPSNAFSGFAEAFVCLKSRFSAARIFYDLRLDLSSLNKMVVNSTTATVQHRMLLEGSRKHTQRKKGHHMDKMIILGFGDAISRFVVGCNLAKFIKKRMLKG